MRRLFGLLFILLLILTAVLVVYAYIGELPAQQGQIETPAVGVGFGS